MSRKHWLIISAIGTVLTVAAIFTPVVNILGIGLQISRGNVDPQLIVAATETLVWLFVALVPTTVLGVFLFILFQLADEQAF